uniref:Uncharacterized protein n=1 Tax=Trichogramma kaykai TaxID=54128 RepID=A0ABD2WT14_9HYME
MHRFSSSSSSSSFKRKREKEEVSSWRTTCSLVTTLWIRELGAWTVYAMMVNVPRCEHTLRARLLYVISSTCAPEYVYAIGRSILQ